MTLAVCAAAAGPLAGCSTTMQRAARLQQNDARIRAAERATRVGRTSPAIRVTAIHVLARHALVVQLRNSSSRTLSDLPISVGYRLAGRAAVVLNGRPGAGYFASHLPIIPAGAAFAWVLSQPRALPRRAHVFALVGARPAVPVTIPNALPAIRAAARAAGGGWVRVVVRNLSSVPQLQLPVYVVARARGRIVAAATALVPELDPGARRRVELHLTGRAGGIAPQTEVLPTIFQ
jgi:hypothetical protein